MEGKTVFDLTGFLFPVREEVCLLMMFSASFHLFLVQGEGIAEDQGAAAS